MADAAGGAVDQDPLSAFDPGDADKRLPGRETDERKRRSLRRRERLRLGDQLVGRGDDAIGVGIARLREADETQNVVADGQRRDTITDRGHRAGDVPAERERRVTEKGEVARSHGDVDRVDAGRGNVDEDLIDTRSGIFDVDDVEHRRRAERGLGDDAHREFLPELGSESGAAPTVRPQAPKRWSEAHADEIVTAREVYDERVLSPVDAAPSQSRSSAAEWGLPGQ